MTATMKQSIAGRIAVRLYKHLPLKSLVLRIVTRIEGGQMNSVSLREILSENHEVIAGPYSYGSLLDPGYADKSTTIGAYVSIGPNVRRFGAQHPLSSLSLHPYWYNPKLRIVSKEDDVTRTPCEIGHDSWIGANATILPNCARIGIGAVIGAGSVVTRDVPDFTIVAGNPARIIGERFSSEMRKRLIQEKLWTLPPHEVGQRMKQIRSEFPSPERAS